MTRLADILREREVTPIVEAGFFNYSRPTFAEGVTRCADHGATRVIIQPYLLIDGYFSQILIPRLIKEEASARPELTFLVTGALGFHSSLVELAHHRAMTVLAENSLDAAGLLVLAHGTPTAGANEPIERIASSLEETFAEVAVGYMETNTPTILEAADDLVARGVERIVALPYFLHLGRHVTEDLPRQIGHLRKRHLGTTYLIAEYLGFDPLLAEVIKVRLAECLHDSTNC
jgi:sirohydrochlorin ferrochelatase